VSVSATARFTLTVDVPLGTWDEGEKMSHLREIARREGIPKLRREMGEVRYAIVGEPKLISMMAADT